MSDIKPLSVAKTKVIRPIQSSGTIPVKRVSQVIIDDNVPDYTGDYEITPNAHNPIVLQTKNKKMVDDVTVKKIPFFDVSNTSGGTTIFIGNEV